ncbi:MAG TPA: YceI family protein [Gemmatimonadetes bacterium]|nr:YceI family protein [Gemmatimonadota bacterium]
MTQPNVSRRVVSVRSGTGIRVFSLACGLLVSVAMDATSQEFHVDRDAENSVRFISQAPVEEVVGHTDRIDGYVLLNGERLEEGSPTEGTQLYLEVDLASLDTGLGLRNRHMRNNYLEVEEFPYATFDATIQGVEVATAGVFGVTARGLLSIHGVEHQRDVLCDVSARQDGYRARCTFTVLLSDFDIEIPKLMFLKLAEEIRLELDFAVRPAPDR